ncbi:uncharacterized protein BcabD6B2_51440 [Babesia caballi]|uniref:Related to Vacuolar membrane protein n=1 Tax=Babesia caballi TaxID=5871 RepID=A0AAV4M030_BABCB|nr:related to Vacuolar membrane protein [Babesia caballi]
MLAASLQTGGAAAAGAVPKTMAAVPASSVRSLVEDGERCTLLPGFFGLSIQVVLCIISICFVVMKYASETPRRPLRVFLMDFITMMCGSGTVHVLNILSSILIQKFDDGNAATAGDECNLYFMTTLFDATFGIYIEYRIVRYLAIRNEANNYLQLTRKSVFKPTTEELANATRIATAAVSGGQPIGGYPLRTENAVRTDDDEFQVLNAASGGMEGSRTKWYWQQLVLLATNPRQWAHNMGNDKFVDNLIQWLCIVCGLKVVSIVLFTVFSGQVNAIGNFLMAFLNHSRTLKLLFVMILAPLVLNVFQYYVTDSIIKLKTVERHQIPCARKGGRAQPAGPPLLEALCLQLPALLLLLAHEPLRHEAVVLAEDDVAVHVLAEDHGALVEEGVGAEGVHAGAHVLRARRPALGVVVKVAGRGLGGAPLGGRGGGWVRLPRSAGGGGGRLGSEPEHQRVLRDELQHEADIERLALLLLRQLHGDCADAVALAALLEQVGGGGNARVEGDRHGVDEELVARDEPLQVGRGVPDGLAGLLAREVAQSGGCGT